MNRLSKSIVCFAVCCLTLSSSALRAENYMIDGSHTSVIFGISHFGYSYTYGRFNRVNGNFAWDNANPAASQFQLAIDAASIDSNDAKRDDHLRNADFFNVKQFPVISFQSTAIKPSPQNPEGNMYDVTGNLTMHGVTKQVTLPMKKLGEGNGPYGKYRCGFFCQTTLNRSDFGMTNMIPNIGNQVAVTISFEGVRQEAAVPGSGSATAPGSGSGSGSVPVPAGSGSAPAAGSSGTR